MKNVLKVSVVALVAIAAVFFTEAKWERDDVYSLLEANVEALCEDTIDTHCTGPKEYDILAKQVYCKCTNFFTCYDLLGCN